MNCKKTAGEIQQKLIERWVNLAENATDFRAIQNLLERLCPEDWAGVQKVQTTTTGFITHKHEMVSDEVKNLSTVELETLLHLFDKMKDKDPKLIEAGSTVIDVEATE